MTEYELDHLRSWIGRSETAHETLSPVPVECLAATLSLPRSEWPTHTLPPLWHWLYFPDTTFSDRLGEDGAPRTQALLPPVPAEQIMWAGAEFEFIAPLVIGVATQKCSRVAEIDAKLGSRGPMVFVTLEHRYEQGGQTVLIERVRIVFLGAAGGGSAPAVSHAAPERVRQRPWTVNEAVLFRFSALTFNTHRIHYDHPYATECAGYPGLVVHGPLQALLIAETFRLQQPQAVVRRAAFRARAPLFCGEDVMVCETEVGGSTQLLWTKSAAGDVAMEGVVYS